jgi:hypothetical protein
MGALRAAECAAYGMVGLGQVFQAYAAGDLVDDAAVAQLHAPAELGHAAVTEALVNVEATFAHLSALSLIDEEERHHLLRAARSVFFKERTYPRILEQAAGLTAERRATVFGLTQSYRRDVKREDAQQLVAYLRALPDRRGNPPPWRFVESPMWRALQATLGHGSASDPIGASGRAAMATVAPGP